MLRPRSVLCLATLATLALGACGGDDDDSADTPADSTPAASDTTPAADPTLAEVGATLSISNLAFGSVTAAAGAPITIVNDDGFGHTVTDRDGGFSISVGGGSSGELTIDAAGTYTIFCEIHPSMAGTIVIS